MTRRTVPTLALVCGCWLLFGAARTAEAGFIAASVDQCTASLSAPASSMAPPRGDQADRSPLRELLQRYQAALASPFAPATGGTAGAPTSAPPGGTPAAVLPVEADQRSQLITRLAPDREVWLPPAFLSGIFRPPRFVV